MERRLNRLGEAYRRHNWDEATDLENVLIADTIELQQYDPAAAGRWRERLVGVHR